jgi:hypothetical protein
VQVDTDQGSPITLSTDEWRTWPQPPQFGVYMALKVLPLNVSVGLIGWRKRQIKVTGDWGFPSIPPEVTQACAETVIYWITANPATHRFAGSPDSGIAPVAPRLPDERARPARRVQADDGLGGRIIGARCKAALLTLLRADSGLRVCKSSTRTPAPAIQQESIFFNRTTENDTSVALGQRKRDEDYTLEVVVSVARDGDDAQGCEERCWAIVGHVENVVRANPTLSAHGRTKFALYDGADMTPYAEGGQRIAEAVCRVAVSHRK